MNFGITPNSSTPEWQIYNRVYLFQISSVSPAKGTVGVTCIDNLVRREADLELPFPGFSPNRSSSSWMRYMPQRGDLVYVAFGPRNDPHIIGYATGRSGSYQKLVGARDRGPYNTVVEGEAVLWNPALREFVDLKEGEWDMRSKGGAYLHGSDSGVLTLAAGGRTDLTLAKADNEGRGSAGLWALSAEGSHWRIGEVRRQLTGYKESRISPLLPPLDPVVQEHWVHIEQPLTDPTTGLVVPTGVNALVYDEQSGCVRDGTTGLATTSAFGAPLRTRRRVYAVGVTTASPVKTAVYSESADAIGNVRVDATASLALDAPVIALGASVIDPLAERALLGTSTVTALQSFTISVLAACAAVTPSLASPALAPLAPFVASLSLALSTLQSTLNTPMGTPGSLLSSKVTLE